MENKLFQDLKWFMAKCLYNYSLKCTLSAYRSHFCIIIIIISSSSSNGSGGGGGGSSNGSNGGGDSSSVNGGGGRGGGGGSSSSNSSSSSKLLTQVSSFSPTAPLLCLVHKLRMLFTRTFFDPFSFLAACMRVSTAEPFYRFSQFYEHYVI
jgi:hypothetical protein